MGVKRGQTGVKRAQILAAGGVPTRCGLAGECPHTPGSAPLHCPGEVVASEETHEKSLSGWEREGLF